MKYLRLITYLIFLAMISISCQQQVVREGSNDKSIIEAVVQVSSYSLANILQPTDIESQHQLMRDFCKDVRFLIDDSGYLMIYDMDGNCIAHGTRPEIQGLNRMNRKDSKGMFNVQEMVRIAKEKGSGWLTYYYQNPSDGFDEKKHTFVMKIPNSGYWMAAGYYDK